MSQITIEHALSEYLRYRLTVNAGYIASHEMEHARNWIRDRYNRLHTVDSISRAWRHLRETGKVRTREERIPGKKELTWKILEVGNNTPHRLRLR